MAIDIKRRHPSYATWAESAEFLWLSYLGGKDYHDAEMLDRYPREYREVYEARKKRAYYLNHFGATVDTYVSSVFKRDPVRAGAEDEQGNLDTELSPGVQAFIEDATGDGDDLNQFSRDVATFALATERAFVGVDVLNRAVPYAYLIHPANLLDFSVEPTSNEIRWAIVAEKEVVDEDPFSERKELQRYRLWTPQGWAIFDEKGNQIDEGSHSAGRVPIVHVPGYKVRLPVYDIALINKRIANHCSQLDEVFANTTFPMLYIPGAEGQEDGWTYEETELSANGDVSPLAVGPAKVLEIPTDKDFNPIIPGYVAPPDGPAKLLMEERQSLVESIRNLAGLERRDPDAISPQSGISKAYDFRETNERLVSLAQVMEEYEAELFDVINGYGIAGEVNVSYLKDFQVRDFELMVDSFLKLAPAPLPPLVKKRFAMQVSEVIFEEATEEEKREMREEIEEMVEFDQSDEPTTGAPTGVPLGQQPVRRRLADFLGSANQPNAENGGNNGV